MYRKQEYLLQVLNKLWERRENPTVVDKRFRIVISVGVGCCVLGIVGVLNGKPLVLFIGTLIVLAALAASIIWQVWEITREVKANEAAGLPAPPTPAATGCFAVFWALVAAGVIDVVLIVVLPYHVMALVSILVPAVTLLGSVIVVSYLQRRRRAGQMR